MWVLKLELAIDTMLSYCASAHVRVPPGSPLEWTFEPFVVATFLTAAALYAIGICRLLLRRHYRPDWLHMAAFAFGMLLVFAALCSPIETVSDSLFSAHMAQHILLMMLAPPLLVWSRPGPVFAAALGDGWRYKIARVWSDLRLDRLSRLIMNPITVFVLFCGAFVFWHLPMPYLWGLSYEKAHLLEHASFLFTALIFWTLIIEPSGERRLSYGAALIFLTVTVLVSDLPGALMVLAPRPLYPIHAAGAAAWGMSPMQDQQLAGLIMWIPAGAIYIAAAMWLFVRLLDESGRHAPKLHRSLPATMAVLLLALPFGGCQDEAKGGQTGGNSARGAALIVKLGCGTCHMVPGIDGATALVGPPLDHMGSRVYIAGVLRNTPDNMIAWLRDPQAVVPGNAMPNMGIDEDQARDITAYLDTLN